MPTPPIESLDAKINALGLKVGNIVLGSDGTEGTASTLLYVDSSKKLAQGSAVTASSPAYVDSSSALQAGPMPFAIALSAGANDSGLSTWNIHGRATGSADELMHLNLVAGANATATIGGYVRTTITDDGGVITDGAYYIPFYTLD